MSASRAKGTLAERLVVDYLKGRGWPYAERRALAGAKDKGDVTGTPGLVWEVKSASRITLPEWLRETEQERINAQAAHGILVVKPKGYGESRIEEWPAVLPLRHMTYLLAELGFGERDL